MTDDGPLLNFLLIYFYFVTYNLPEINVKVLRLTKVVK